MAQKTPGDATKKISCETEKGSDMELRSRVRTFFTQRYCSPVNALEYVCKSRIFPSSRIFYPNGRMCFQSVDEARLSKYDEGTIKQQFNCADNRSK